MDPYLLAICITIGFGSVLLKYHSVVSRRLKNHRNEMSQLKADFEKINLENDENLVNLTTITMQFKEAEAEIRRLQNIDGVTGVSNRIVFDSEFESEWKRGFRSMQPLALIFVDVDYFKLYNDSYGHDRGDACLRQIAEGIWKCVNRPGDIVARYSKDRFALLLPNTDTAGMETIANRVRKSIENLAMAHEYSPEAPFVTVSCGAVSIIPNNVLQPQLFLKRAREALIESKESGRNRVTIY